MKKSLPRSLPRSLPSSLPRVLLVVIFSLVFMSCGLIDQIIEPTPTNTPIPPTDTPTPVPTDTPTPEPEGIPGWKKFEGGGIELWLPESFEGGNLDENLDYILEIVNGLGPDFQQYADLIALNKDVFVIFAFDTNIGANGESNNVNVTTAQTSPSVTIEDYLAAAMTQIPAAMTVTSSDVLTLNDYDAGRLEFHYSLQGVELAQIMYIIKDGGNFWIVTYTTNESIFGEMLLIFEDSIGTFEITQ